MLTYSGCGEQLTDRHHIIEFSEGGLHSQENLILLCPNCHRDTHRGQIRKEELLLRKSTHIKNDRISGGIRLSSEELKCRVGSILYINTPKMIVCEKETILEASVENDNLLLSVKLFDNEGRLIFWMNKNRFWCDSNFMVNYSLDYIEIKNKLNKSFIKVEKNEDILDINGEFYFNKVNLKTPLLQFHNFVAENCNIGFQFSL